ncbi:MAG: ABC transporter ATP-binding protein [Clostridia bacterium]|nr:ABC transporter ATP-binding protein [Clostridia bacterium]
MAEIEFKKVTKAFGSNKVIEDLDLTIQDGKFTVLVGASGCGKTTLLRMIAGIGPATSGQVLMDGKDITDLDPAKRDIAMVFQNYAIYPTMSVKENIEFGLKNRKVPKEEREKLIKEYAEVVGLSAYLDRKPGTLSGGQRQRIALARAMVKRPKVFLMDEPLSNLDAKLRVAMRTELIEMHNRMQTTFIYVTHDQVEAMAMADVIVLMDKGKIMQEASPEVIYRDPNNVYTAQFIGTPPMNVIALDDDKVGFRPEKIVLADRKLDNMPFAREGVVLTREMLGSETQYKVQMGADTIMVKTPNDSYKYEDKVVMNVAAEDLYFFDAAGERIRRGDVSNYDEYVRRVGG